MHILDAHCHFWQLDRGDYGWLAGEGGPLAPIRRDYQPDDYPGHCDVIAVQAAPTLAETDHLLSLAARAPRIKGVVGWADLSDPAAADALGARMGSGRLKGVRPMLQDISDTNWLLNAPHPTALAAIQSLGLTFDALITERHLPVLGRFLRENPTIPTVIDHGAKPQPGLPQSWRDGMRDLAALPGVHCKLSGLMTELSTEAEILLAGGMLLDWFGPERLIWGSDWPVMTLAGDYERWLRLTDQILAGADTAARSAIMGGNARRFYGVRA